MSKVIVGVDLGGTFIKVALVSLEKQVLEKDGRPTAAEDGPDRVIASIADGVEDLLRASGVPKTDVLALGIGMPGPLNWQTGIVYTTPNMPGWEDVPIVKKLEARLGIKCFLENDANAACYGEYWLGAGQGARNMAVLTLGTGVGGGVVIFGRLLRGDDGTAAELGHLIVHRGGRRCGCGSRGCLEAYASVTGMVKTAVEGIEAGKGTALKEACGGDYAKLTGKLIFDTAVQGDAFANWVFEETATWLGLGIASIINYQNPEKVVLCGGMIAAGDLLFNPVRRVAKENAFEVPANRCEILPAGLGADAGVLGAAGCALERLEREG